MTESDLKSIVERAVRPVRASTSWKARMREELLAHVAEVFEAEAAKGGAPDALARTAERFGDPDALAAKLQESVPARDGMQRLADQLWFRPGDSVVRRFLRYGFMHSLILILFVPIWLLWLQASLLLARALDLPIDKSLRLGGPVPLFDVVFIAFLFLILAWGLVRTERVMSVRFRAHEEWGRLPIE